MEQYNKKTGFISLIGRPSSGKSTLINTICGYKISIVSKHPQTTQFIVRGIYNDDTSQIIFIDTPGFHHFESNLNKGLSNLAVRTLDEGDLILYLVDLSREFGKEEEDIISHLEKAHNPIIAVFNKLDIKTDASEELINKIKERLNLSEIIEVSAKDNKNVDALVKHIQSKLPYGPEYYPEDYVTDQSIPFRITEVVREKVYELTKNEIPHSIYVEVNKLDVTEKKIIAHAIIYAERDSQKGILIGQNGEMIKKIGENARLELKDIFERNVNLFLKIKIHYKWKRKDQFLKKRFNFS